MQNGQTTWHALGFLKKMQQVQPALSFCVKYDENNLPEVIMWMSPKMKKRLIRYGDVLFIDAQKREFNHFGWPYIGITVKDGSNQISVCSESIVASEDLGTYAWILSTMSKMVPQYSLSNIRIIFGDQFLKESLLDSLGIQDSVTLRCDYWHVLTQVWPSNTSFGKATMAKIGGYLKGMLLSHTQAQWDLLYHKALREIEEDPNKVSKLIAIGNNPKYYAGYYLTQLEGNLGMLGSSPAEQNHASIVAHLGKGASWSIAEHITQLFKRQEFINAKEEQQMNDYYVSTYRYKSMYSNQYGQDDVNARKLLTEYAHDNFFMKALKFSQNLSYCLEANGDFVTWPMNEERSSFNINVIKKDQRCQCKYRCSYMIQCGHEYKRDGVFRIDKYHNKWLNDKSYQEHHEFQIIDTMFDETDNTNNGADNDALSTVVTNENDFMSIENSTLGKASNHKVLYSDLTKACNELIRFVTNDQKRSKAVFSTITQWTRLLKEGVDVNVSFERSSLNGNIDESVPAISKMSTCLDNTASDLNSKNSDFLNARPSVISPNHASGKSVRKKSWLEFNHRKKVRRENELKKCAYLPI